MRRGTAAASAILLATTGCVVASASSVLKQGDQIIVGDDVCTVGYVDSLVGVVHTAGDCGVTGDTVRFPDGSQLGRIQRSSYTAGPAGEHNNIAFIWADGVARSRLGTNTYTGGFQGYADQVGLGDTACILAPSRGGEVCTTVMGTVGNQILIDDSVSLPTTDRGAPVKVNNRYVGVFNGTAPGVGAAIVTNPRTGETDPAHPLDYDSTLLNYQQWDASYGTSVVAANQGDTMGTTASPRSDAITSTCIITYVESLHQRVYTHTNCGDDGDIFYTTTNDDTRAATYLGPLTVEGNRAYIDLPSRQVTGSNSLNGQLNGGRDIPIITTFPVGVGSNAISWQSPAGPAYNYRVVETNAPHYTFLSTLSATPPVGMPVLLDHRGGTALHGVVTSVEPHTDQKYARVTATQLFSTNDPLLFPEPTPTTAPTTTEAVPTSASEQPTEPVATEPPAPVSDSDGAVVGVLIAVVAIVGLIGAFFALNTTGLFPFSLPVL